MLARAREPRGDLDRRDVEKSCRRGRARRAASGFPARAPRSPPHARRRKASRSAGRPLQTPTAAGYRRGSSVPDPFPVPPVSSRYSQALALRQSRLTVPVDIFSTSPISSTLSPPKNRISTICAFRGSIRASADERLVERDESRLRIPGRPDDDHVVQRHMLDAATALDVAAPRMVHQDAAHHLRRHGKEMRAILPLHARVVGQAHIGFVDQGGRLQAVARALATHVVAGQTMQLGIDDGRQPASNRMLVAVAPGAEQCADVAVRRGLPRPRRPFHVTQDLDDPFGPDSTPLGDRRGISP